MRSERVFTTADIVTAAAVSQAVTEVVNLLRADRRVAAALRRAATATRYPNEHADAAIDRFLWFLGAVLPEAIRHALDDDRERLGGIRDLFLGPKESYTIDELAALWQVPVPTVREIYNDELRRATEHPLYVTRADAIGAATTFRIFRSVDIERALGKEFSRVRGAAWKTTPAVVFLPRFVTDAARAAAEIGVQPALAARIEHFVLNWCEVEHLIKPLAADR